MSFILDALRRADAQRQSNPALGIHAQAMPPLEAGQDDPLLPASPVRRLLPWSLALAACGLAAWVTWVAWQSIDPPESAAAVPAATIPASVAAPVAPVIVPPAPAQGVSALAGSAPALAANRAVSAAETARAGWPADAPSLAVSGGVYSAQAGQRMVIVNGQVHGEGAEPVAGVRVEAIRPGSVVLLYRGQRYSLSY